MEQNLPIITKKLWNMVILAFFMLRKGITTKKKLLLDINLMIKRGKIASKVALSSIIFHHNPHHHHLNAFPSTEAVPKPSHLKSSPTTAETHYFTNKGKKHHQKCYSMPSPNVEDTTYIDAINNYMLESMTSSKEKGVRLLRITDSPYPMPNEESCDHRVDRAAEDFIKRFYSKLKEQNY